MPQAAALPHLHVPPAQLSALPAAHWVQAMLFEPHAVTVRAPASRQLLPEQQPPQPEPALQTHWPASASQERPGPQAGPLPQRHAPLVQALAFAGAQAAHAAPPEPQLANEPASNTWQRLPLQQPLGHEAALQVQVPASQNWPVPHCGPLPQLQLPPKQLFARTGLHATQADPAVPHAVTVPGARQFEPAQHPFEQVVGLQLAGQVPLLQFAQGTHASPPEPQAIVEVPGWQTPFASQQPLGQLTASQTQPLPVQCRPGPQAAPPLFEHSQSPFTEQRFALSGSHVMQPRPMRPQLASPAVRQVSPSQQPLAQLVASQMQRPDWQRCPPPHSALLPHWHMPVREQLLVVSPGHMPHAAPPTPHFVGLLVWHTPLGSQHPRGQLVASQTHWPASQR